MNYLLANESRLTETPNGYTMYIRGERPMLVTISRWGNSLGLRLPATFAKQIGLESGEQVEMQLEGQRIVISRKGFALSQLLAQVTPENLHSEVETGVAVGREEW